MTNTLIAPGPGVDAHYDKIHLYDAFGFTESRTVAPGHEPVVITVDGVRVGLTLCYDIRFPELYVELARRGAQLITVHASWGTGPGKLEQWTLLARARALDTAQFRRRGRSGISGRRDRRARTDGSRRQRRGVAVGRGRRHRQGPTRSCSSPMSTPMPCRPVRDTIAVLRNRTDFTEVR